MNKLFLGLLAVIMAVPAFAQKGSGKQMKSPEERANKQADRLKTELTLTDDQRTKMYDACLVRAKAVQTAREKYKDSANKKNMHTDVQSAQTQFKNSIATFLTSDQLTKYNELEKKKKGEMKGKGKKKKGSKKPSNEAEDEDDDL